MAEIFLVLLVLLALSRFIGELAERIGQPALLGEVCAGLLIGAIVYSMPGLLPQFEGLAEDAGFKVITHLGIFFLMFYAGLEFSLKEMREAARAGLPVALGGVTLPLVGGIWVGYAFLPPSEYLFAQSLFLGVVLSITAIPVSVKVLMDIGYLKTRLGRTLVAAALIDDIIGIALLAILVGLLEQARIPTFATFGMLALKVFLFLGVVYAVDRFGLRVLSKLCEMANSAEIDFTIALVFAIFMALISEAMGIHIIIGAFFAGLLINRETFGKMAFEAIESNCAAITVGFLAPIFFASIGMHVDLSALASSLLFTVVLLGVAIAGKLLGAGVPSLLAGFSTRDSLALGFAMNGRGAVELIVAVIALEAGLFEVPQPVPAVVRDIFSAAVIIAIVTTLMTPVSMKALLKSETAKERPRPPV